MSQCTACNFEDCICDLPPVVTGPQGLPDRRVPCARCIDLERRLNTAIRYTESLQRELDAMDARYSKAIPF